MTEPLTIVYRLALLALPYWKSDTAPFHAEMKKLQRDKDRHVGVYKYAAFNG
ncbi:MAG: hypothetical protein RL240_4449 [Planctomycetota bacterium]